jgi:hypothetical protein
VVTLARIIGYAVTRPEIRKVEGERWSGFTARKDGAAREACERIRDEQGGAWTDASAWSGMRCRGVVGGDGGGAGGLRNRE